MSDLPVIGIIAPCSATPGVELSLGVDRLIEAGFEVRVHPQCGERHYWFAGDDRARAGALYEYACDPGIDVVWSSRGGSGGPRLLPILDELTAERGKPGKKLLVGYSDVTALHEYVHTRWGWETLHGSMPASDFYDISDEHYGAMLDLVCKKGVAMPWLGSGLRFLTPPPLSAVRGTLVGGNLAVWNYLTGTPYQRRDMRGKFLFFEDLSEGYYRIDSMVTQIEQAGGLEGIAGIILGDFCACDDSVARVLKERPARGCEREALKDKDKQETVALRAKVGEVDALREIFGRRGERYGFSVGYQIPVGHGPNFAPLPLNAGYELTPGGGFELVDWGWLG
jgi:muramoyltetrapeptide carboxypeptidase